MGQESIRTPELAWAILTVSDPFPGSDNLLEAMTYLTDRHLGRRTHFESTLYGPVSLEVRDALERWVSGDLLRFHTITGGWRYDFLDYSETSIHLQKAPELAKYQPTPTPEEIAGASEVFGLLWAQKNWSSAAVVIAADLCWAEEFNGNKRDISLREAVHALRWAGLTTEQREAGLALAQIFLDNLV
jgi:hypothetical protein